MMLPRREFGQHRAGARPRRRGVIPHAHRAGRAVVSSAAAVVFVRAARHPQIVLATISLTTVTNVVAAVAAVVAAIAALVTIYFARQTVLETEQGREEARKLDGPT